MYQKKTLVTEEGLQKIKEELEQLKTVKRREVAQAIQIAKEQGDLSENAEYVEAKEAQGLLEQRIADLENSLKSAEVIQKESGDIVCVGDSVTLKINGGEVIYTLVGPNEADPSTGKISNESPLGIALIGKREGEKTYVKTPTGNKEVKIVKVR